MTASARAAVADIQAIRERHLPGRYTVEVIDLLERPQLAERDRIIAVATLVEKLPAPVRKIVGDLSRTEKVLVGLDIRPSK